MGTWQVAAGVTQHGPSEAAALSDKSSFVSSSLGTSQPDSLMTLQGKIKSENIVAVIWANMTVDTVTRKHQVLQETFIETFAPVFHSKWEINEMDQAHIKFTPAHLVSFSHQHIDYT